MTAIAPARTALRLPWPLPALAAWAAGWLLSSALAHGGVRAPLALGCGLIGSTAPAVLMRTTWRRIIVAAGFPLSLVVSGAAASLPAWPWLIPLAALVLAYPVSAWRDAPVFPTPRDALAGLPAVLPLPDGARIHDAGCGLGHGLRALRAAWPAARLSGVERSAPLALATRLACPWARIEHGDMWRRPWTGLDLVYLFQRPESMARAHAKACTDMVRGGWLVSLEFEVPGTPPHARLDGPGGRPVLVYRIAPPA